MGRQTGMAGQGNVFAAARILIRPFGKFVFLVTILLFRVEAGVLAETFVSHPPMRPLPEASTRPKGEGPARFADPVKGSDKGDGTQKQPWKSLSHAIPQLKPGDTLYLRGGTYYEPVSINGLVGRANVPITIRSYPEELAVIDGGYREFFENPRSAWEPDPAGAPGEFRSVQTYAEIAGKAKNVNALGNFSDSLVPLHGYRNHYDLRATSCYWQVEGKVFSETGVYCGPGVVYDPDDTRIHIRLAHTDLAGWGEKNYTGEQDPRKLSLVIAAGPNPAFQIVSSSWVRVQDVVVRGSRVATFRIGDASDIELDGITVYGGSTPLGVSGTAGLRITNSAFRGIQGPWSTRSTMKYRGIESKLFSASGWAGFNGNCDFDVSYSEFTDSCDGIFIGNVKNAVFHHCLLDNCSDDGFFVTATTGEDGLIHGGGHRIYRNLLRRCLTTFAFGVGHGVQKEAEYGIRQTGAGLYIFRNLIDLREPVHYGHPRDAAAARAYAPAGRCCGDHGGPIWEPMWVYHNTVITREDAFRNYYGSGFGGHMGQPNVPRRVLNNIFVQNSGIPGVVFPPAYLDFHADGNLFWSPQDGPSYPVNDFSSAIRRSRRAAGRSGAIPPVLKRPEPVKIPDKPGEIDKEEDLKIILDILDPPPPPPAIVPVEPDWGTRDRFSDPRFVQFGVNWQATNDYRLQTDSPAVGAGVMFPAAWPDSLRAPDGNNTPPDVGALSRGAETWHVGVRGRIVIVP